MKKYIFNTLLKFIGKDEIKATALNDNFKSYTSLTGLVFLWEKNQLAEPYYIEATTKFVIEILSQQNDIYFIDLLLDEVSNLKDNDVLIDLLRTRTKEIMADKEIYELIKLRPNMKNIIRVILDEVVLKKVQTASGEELYRVIKYQNIPDEYWDAVTAKTKELLALEKEKQ